MIKLTLPSTRGIDHTRVASVLDVVSFWLASTSELHLWVGSVMKLAGKAPVSFNWGSIFVAVCAEVL